MFFDRKIKKFIKNRKLFNLKNFIIILLLLFLRQVLVNHKSLTKMFQKTSINASNETDNINKKVFQNKLIRKLTFNFITDNYKKLIEKAMIADNTEKINEHNISNYKIISEAAKDIYLDRKTNYEHSTFWNEEFIKKTSQSIGMDGSNRRILVDNYPHVLDKVTVKDKRFSESKCPEYLLGVPKSLKRLKNCTECSKITCRNLLYSHPLRNETYYSKVKALLKKYKTSFDNDIQAKIFELLESSCEKYKAWRSYDLSAPVEGEMEDTPYTDLSESSKNISISQKKIFLKNKSRKAYSIAYNILVHDNFKQAESLLRAIYRPQHFYCIHVDKKNTLLVNQIKKLAACFSNVYLPSKLETVIYQGFSRLQADLNCMQEHLARDSSWKYLINTAASAYPLKTSLELVQVLKIYNGTNNIGMINTKNDKELQKRFKRIHRLVVKGNITKVMRYPEAHPPPPHNLTIVKGNAYGVFSRKFVNFMFTNKIAKDYLDWCKDTFSPDEHYWNTLHHTFSNPHLHAPGGFNGPFFKGNTNPVYVVWGDGKCYGMRRNTICVFGVRDLPNVINQPNLFANKFLINFEPLAYECMENWLMYKKKCPGKMDLKYHLNLPFVRLWNS